MGYRKHEASPTHHQGAETAVALHHARFWEISRFFATYVRLVKESLSQEPKYFDE